MSNGFYISCYAGQLNQVFMNLLVNAIDALEESCEKHQQLTPQIQIQTELTADNSMVQIRISDNAHGMPVEVLNRIFDQFFTTKPVGKGTGLGLAISYEIITKKHQGIIEVDSTIGVGTNFTISLPASEAV
jgi:two-component system, NtrC family, sensor kinase